MTPPRVVFDTNVVLAALIFRRGTAPVRDAWQSGRIMPLASRATASELVRALAYPKFALDAPAQAELLADYMPWVEAVEIPVPAPSVPRCRDPDDLPFLELAVVAKAAALVSGDRDLLALAGTRGICPILDIAQFARRFLDE